VSEVQDFDWSEGRLEAAAGDGAMELIVNGDVTAIDPAPQEVRQALESLPGGDQDSFVVVCQRDQYYMQTVGCAAVGFHVEYREGSDARQFMMPGLVSLDETVAAFESYLLGDERYKDEHKWVPLAAPSTSPMLPPTAGEVARLLAVQVLFLAGGLVILLGFTPAFSPAFVPFTSFGLAMGVLLWIGLFCGPRRVRGFVGLVLFVAIIGLITAAEWMFGFRTAHMFGIASGVGFAATLLVSTVWNLMRGAGEIRAGGPSNQGIERTPSALD
jgi:hypothetical protein